MSEGNGSGTLWSVQARSFLAHPEIATNGQIFGNEWRLIHFNQGKIGVPQDSFVFGHHGLFPDYCGYDSAMSLAYWFKACNPWKFRVRIVAHKYSYSHKIENDGEFTEIDPPKDNTASEDGKHG